MSSFQHTQNDEYLKICETRLRDIELTWVEQVLVLIQLQNLPHNISINDMGCNMGHFYKGIKKRQLKYSYNGYDLDEIYLQKARQCFPEIANRFKCLDICNDKPDLADVSVASAVLEHVPDFNSALNNILITTKTLCILRTYSAILTINDKLLKSGAEYPYAINQNSFEKIFLIFQKNGFDATIIRDVHTDSMPIHKGNGIVRTMYIFKGVRL